MTFPVTQVRRVAKVLNGGTPPSGQTDMWDGDIGFVTPPDLNGLDGAPIKQTARTITREGLQHSALAPAGAVMLSTRAPIGHIARVETPVAFNQGCRALVARANVDERFLAYALVAAREQMNSRGLGTTFIELSGSSLAEIGIPLCNLGTQRAIADYLDRETAQIDAFIVKNEDLIALLTERRTVVGQQLVERRVGDGARIKFRFREIDQRAGERWEDLPLLSVSIHHGVVRRDEAPGGSVDGAGLSHYRVCRQGDIVVNRMRAFQGALGVSAVDGLVSPDYAVLRVDDGIDPRWFALMMRTPRFVGEMVRRLRGIGSTDSGAVRTPRIGVSDLGEIRVDVPSLREQRDEVTVAASSTKRIDDAVECASRAISFARERRAALISAAVTGKIDVGVAA